MPSPLPQPPRHVLDFPWNPVYRLPGMEFEFDEEKSRANKQKHGIDFCEAQMLWTDSDHVQIPARTADEPRFLVVGTIRDKHWSAIITRREGRTRTISVRWAQTKDVDLYES